MSRFALAVSPNLVTRRTKSTRRPERRFCDAPFWMLCARVAAKAQEKRLELLYIQLNSTKSSAPQKPSAPRSNGDIGDPQDLKPGIQISKN
ncbi:40S ribosomal protein S23-2 [Zea mays]|uniref:40S ribosomal protein S23-2 n=1 Tax=Zea mays TaxID=4577 RepID=A0A1D6NL32_MAIZE|nr:40S ribosomal protein S23-2 [Zea mays]